MEGLHREVRPGARPRRPCLLWPGQRRTDSDQSRPTGRWSREGDPGCRHRSCKGWGHPKTAWL